MIAVSAPSGFSDKAYVTWPGFAHLSLDALKTGTQLKSLPMWKSDDGEVLLSCLCAAVSKSPRYLLADGTLGRDLLWL